MPAADAMVPLDTWPATVTQVDCEAHLMQTRWESLPGPEREGLRSGLSGSAMAGAATHLHASYRRVRVVAGAGGAWG